MSIARLVILPWRWRLPEIGCTHLRSTCQLSSLGEAAPEDKTWTHTSTDRCSTPLDPGGLAAHHETSIHDSSNALSYVDSHLIVQACLDWKTLRLERRRNQQIGRRLGAEFKQ